MPLAAYCSLRVMSPTESMGPAGTLRGETQRMRWMSVSVPHNPPQPHPPPLNTAPHSPRLIHRLLHLHTTQTLTPHSTHHSTPHPTLSPPSPRLIHRRLHLVPRSPLAPLGDRPHHLPLVFHAVGIGGVTGVTRTHVRPSNGRHQARIESPLPPITTQWPSCDDEGRCVGG